jgi:hypothetical protein
MNKRNDEESVNANEEEENCNITVEQLHRKLAHLSGSSIAKSMQVIRDIPQKLKRELRQFRCISVKKQI